MNTNHLEGRACPKCGYDEHFRVEGMAVFIVVDDGTEDHAGARYDEDSWANCPECNYTGTWKDFKATETMRKAVVPNEGWTVGDIDFWDESRPEALEGVQSLIESMMHGARNGDHVFIVKVATGDCPDALHRSETVDKVTAAMRAILDPK